MGAHSSTRAERKCSDNVPHLSPPTFALRERIFKSERMRNQAGFTPTRYLCSTNGLQNIHYQTLAADITRFAQCFNWKSSGVPYAIVPTMATGRRNSMKQQRHVATSHPVG